MDGDKARATIERNALTALLTAAGLDVPEDQLDVLADLYADVVRHRTALAAVDLDDTEPACVVSLSPETGRPR